MGREYAIPGWKRKKVDGYREDAHGRKYVIEFLGSYYHGHPHFWHNKEDAVDKYGKPHKGNFYYTETNLKKLASFGYIVYYVWDRDVLKAKKDVTPFELLRHFKGTLEYTL